MRDKLRCKHRCSLHLRKEAGWKRDENLDDLAAKQRCKQLATQLTESLTEQLAVASAQPSPKGGYD